jgi:hypothetical protein
LSLRPTALNEILGLAILVAGLFAGRLQATAGMARKPWLTFAIAALVALALAAQEIWPGLLSIFQRDAVAIQHGQVYRLFTALWFQDGWFEGGLFNLAMLGLVGIWAEQVWPRPIWAALYFGIGLAVECLGLVWQPIGAGNSIAVFGLAGSLLMTVWGKGRAGIVLMMVAQLAIWLLCIRHDVHGAAALIGLVTGFLLVRRARQRNQIPAREFPAA